MFALTVAASYTIWSVQQNLISVQKTQGSDVEADLSAKYQEEEKSARFPGALSQQGRPPCSQTSAGQGQEEIIGVGSGAATVEKKHRLTRSADFQRVYRQGKSVAGRYAVLYYFERPVAAAQEPRLGVSVSKKVGGAVVRNRVKRVLKETFRALKDSVPANYDYVIIARPGLADYLEESQFAEAVEITRDLLRRANLIQEA